MVIGDNLEDHEIPQRDKVREAIIDEWHRNFDALKKELSVRSDSKLHVLPLN